MRFNRNDTYCGCEHYWFVWENGTGYVYREGFEDNEIVYQGHYEDCMEYMETMRIAYEESRF